MKAILAVLNTTQAEVKIGRVRDLNHDFCYSGAVLYQPSWQVNWELVILLVPNKPVTIWKSYMWTADKEVNEYQSFSLRKCSRDLLDKRRASKNYNFLTRRTTLRTPQKKRYLFSGLQWITNTQHFFIPSLDWFKVINAGRRRKLPDVMLLRKVTMGVFWWCRDTY